jgi:hypothetical protein
VLETSSQGSVLKAELREQAAEIQSERETASFDTSPHQFVYDDYFRADRSSLNRSLATGPTSIGPQLSAEFTVCWMYDS